MHIECAVRSLSVSTVRFGRLDGAVRSATLFVSSRPVAAAIAVPLDATTYGIDGVVCRQLMARPNRTAAATPPSPPPTPSPSPANTKRPPNQPTKPTNQTKPTNVCNARAQKPIVGRTHKNNTNNAYTYTHKLAWETGSAASAVDRSKRMTTTTLLRSEVGEFNLCNACLKQPAAALRLSAAFFGPGEMTGSGTAAAPIKHENVMSVVRFARTQ